MQQASSNTPNGKKIAADKTGVAAPACGSINLDIQMRANVRHMFAIGGIVVDPSGVSGRATANGRGERVAKLLFDDLHKTQGYGNTFND